MVAAGFFACCMNVPCTFFYLLVGPADHVLQLAHSLYRTRNSLAHTVIMEIGKARLLPVSYDGAIDLAEDGQRALGWFGESGTCIPSNEFIETGPWC